MTLTSEDAETILAERHSTIARQLGVGDLSVRSYFDSPGLDGLADRLVATFDSPRLHSFGVNPLDGYQLVLRSCPWQELRGRLVDGRRLASREITELVTADRTAISS